MVANANAIDLATVIFRGSVLAIVALGGCMSIFLGWKLYKDGLLSHVQGSLKQRNGWNISLSSAGPGVFFAAFGMWLLITLTNRDMGIKETTALDPSTTSDSSVGTAPSKSSDRQAPGTSPVSSTLVSGSSNNLSSNDQSRKCIVATREIRMLGGDSLTGERAKTSLNLALSFLGRLDESKMVGPDVVQLERTKDTLEEMQEAAGNWDLK
ncbi:MAG TPA: hypothetical protein VH722_15685 [Alphaproteobacteria bacterium]|jgi:hypothetical protein|nr:hypothetical protein [Alphaproteobacteria bacterium]